MEVRTNIPLKNFTTMKLGGNARFFADVHNNEEVQQLCRNAKSKNIPIFIIGSGSNIIAKDEGYAGLIIRTRILGFDVIGEDMSTKTIKIGASENWDEVVKKTVDMGLSGIEAMSAIPGTTGATPVQNVGAYGQEIADRLVSVDAYDIEEDKFVTLLNEDCNFAYRDSIFKSKYPGRYLITYVTLQLSKDPPKPPFYESLQKYLDDLSINHYTPQVIRDAVISIRKNRLPNPAEKPNVGSFFKNVFVEDWKLDDIKRTYPDIPAHQMPDGTFKIPAGWMIEQTGMKGFAFNGIRISADNALVLINESAKSYKDLAKTRDKIIGAVRDLFMVQLEQEPIEI